MKCIKCNYEWTPRKKSGDPKACPSCKRYIKNAVKEKEVVCPKCGNAFKVEV